MPKTEEDYIPEAVKKQGQKAIEAQKLASGKEPEPTQPIQDPVTPEPAKTEPAPVVPGKPKVDDPATPAEGDLEHKYKVLQGMYNKETMELRNALTDTKNTLESQNKVIENMQKMMDTMAAAPTAPATSSPAPAPIEVLKVDDFSAYGTEMEDLIKTINDLVHRVATLEKKGPATTTDPNLVDRLNRVENLQVRTVKDKFYDALDNWDASWGVKNHDPEFKKWLQDVDPVSQVQRAVMLNHAFKNWNVAQVIAIFDQYFGAPTSAPNPESTTPSLKDQVTPDTTGNADGKEGGQPPKTYSTLEDLKKAQTDFISKRISEADYDKIAASFQAGVAAGVNKAST